MNAFTNFIGDPTVLRTVTGSMLITAFCAALPKPGSTLTWGSIYKLFYDWLLGFWSLKTGHQADKPLMHDQIEVSSKVEVSSKAGNE
jgi:hypothetical protein